jgi:hypothetical protein
VTVTWGAVLDEIEGELAAFEAALANHYPVPEPSRRSEPAGPLPADLAPRAEALLARTRRLESRAEVDRDRIAANLIALAGRHPAPAPARTGRLVDVAG